MKNRKIALLLSAVIAAAPVQAIAEGLGINTHVGQGYEPSDNIEIIEEADIGWVRDECKWSSVEAIKDVFQVPYSAIRYYKTLKENGVKVLLVLDYGRSGYTLNDSTTTTDRVVPTTSETAYMEGWKEYVRTVVGALNDYVEAYEVWNEPTETNLNAAFAISDEAAAAAYADCYMTTKELLEEIAPGKAVVFGALTGYPTTGRPPLFLSALQSEAQSRGKTFDDATDDISVHFYATSNTDLSNMISHYSVWKSTLDSYGFTGNIWQTETGLSDIYASAIGTTQEAILPMIAIQYDKMLYSGSRGGVSFWYDLRDDGTNPSSAEHHYGLVDNSYGKKDSFYSMAARNKAVNYMPMTNYETPSYRVSLTTYYGVLATYSDGVNITYASYDTNNRSKTTSVNLTGTKAYVYDYLGNLIETLDPAVQSTYDIPLDPNVTYVACVNPRTYLKYVDYDEKRMVLTVRGETSELDNVTALDIVLENGSGTPVYSEEVPVSGGKFETQFTPPANGTYTLKAGQDVTNYYAEESVIITGISGGTEGISIGGAAAAVNGETVTVTGTVNGEANGEKVSVMVVPQAADLSVLSAENVAYIDDTAISGGAFSFSFRMPEKSYGTYKVLLSGADISNKSVLEPVVYGEETGYVNVCDFVYDQSSAVTVTASVNNPSSQAKTCIIAIAQYTSSDALSAVSFTPVTVDENTALAVEVSATEQKAPDASSAKAFIWDSVEGEMHPLFNGLAIPLN